MCGRPPASFPPAVVLDNLFVRFGCDFVNFECPGNHFGGNFGILAPIWTLRRPKVPQRSYFGDFGPGKVPRLEGLLEQVFELLCDFCSCVGVFLRL